MLLDLEVVPSRMAVLYWMKPLSAPPRGVS